MKHFFNILITILITYSAQSQTAVDIHSHLLNKYWSNDSNGADKIVFSYSDEGSLSVYMSKKKIGYEDYHISSIETDNFDPSKVGSASNGHFIITERVNYEILFYADFKKIKMRTVGTNDWQTFYWSENFSPIN